MRVRLTLDVDARMRYVVARYFGDPRPRATREQVRQFAHGALGLSVREYADALRGRARTTARRLAAQSIAEAMPTLVPAREQQLRLTI